MKKKGILLIALLIALILSGTYAVNLVNNSGRSDTELLEFAIKDTASVDKIIIHEPNGMEFEILRGANNIWTGKDGACIVQEPVQLILKTMYNIEFKGYLQKAAKENIKREMSASSTKVSIYTNGKLNKIWYVGLATQDHYGTFMLLETPSIKSDWPVIMKVKGLRGFISPRFFADQRKWDCTQVFALKRDEIKEVIVQHLDVPERSFTVKNFGDGKYEVTNQGKKIADLDTNNIIRYLNRFRKIHYEYDNFELSKRQLDSLKKSTPFCTLKVKQTNGKSTYLRMFHHQGSGDIIGNDFGDDTDYDVNRFWCELPSGKVVKCQFFVFNPLINGRVYFGIDYKKQALKE